MKTSLLLLLGIFGCSLITTSNIIAGEGKGRDRAKERKTRKGPPEEILQEFDEDGDGKLSEEEREKAKEAHPELRKKRRQEKMRNRLDKDGDGEISEEEKAAAGEARKKRIEEFDLDKDGKLSKEERQAMRETMRKRHREKKRKAECKADPAAPPQAPIIDEE